MNTKDYKAIAEKEIEKAGITNVEYINGNYGRAYLNNNKIRIPIPKTLTTLATALHEIGHIVIGKVKPQYYSEFLAEMFVRQKFKEYSLPLKRKIANHQKEYVAYRVGLSKRRTKNEFKIKSEVKQFLKNCEVEE